MVHENKNSEGGKGQRSEDAERQRAEVRGRGKTEVRGQKSEVGERQRSDVRIQRSEAGGQRSDARDRRANRRQYAVGSRRTGYRIAKRLYKETKNLCGLSVLCLPRRSGRSYWGGELLAIGDCIIKGEPIWTIYL